MFTITNLLENMVSVFYVTLRILYFSINVYTIHLSFAVARVTLDAFHRLKYIHFPLYNGNSQMYIGAVLRVVH